ncbi:MAG: T9SS type A sorting domain-containing protein [Ignavibacteriae bacterium]|nr:T9SS type A sorting domain-containing protein [Ignavibacteriota bacterium]
MKLKLATLTTLFVLMLCLQESFAQTVKQTKTVHDGGGGFSRSSQFIMNSSVGQPNSGTSASSQFRQGVGFWNGGSGGGQPPVPLMFYNDGWNMVSVPFIVPNYSKTFIFPTSSSSAFSYEGGYQQQDTLEHGVGYWLKFPEDQALPLQGGPRNNDTIEVADSWNMIGTTSIPVDTGNVSTLPENLLASNFFGYNSGYYTANIIEPGRAYWIKASGAGSIILHEGIPISLSSTKPIQEQQQPQESVEATQNSISFEIADNNLTNIVRKQVLYFGSGANAHMNKFELPPAPPREAFDVRFASNRMIVQLEKEMSEPIEIPIRLQTNGRQVKVSLSLQQQDGIKYSIIERDGKKPLKSYKLEHLRPVTMTIDEDKKYYFRAETVPKTFTLYQNFPNPFNPSTTIRFDLPVASSVTIQVFNILGQEVATQLSAQDMEEGHHAIEFDASLYSSGLYYYRINAQSLYDGKLFSDTKSMLLLK